MTTQALPKIAAKTVAKPRPKKTTQVTPEASVAQAADARPVSQPLGESAAQAVLKPAMAARPGTKTLEKKDVQKLQRAIADGLEDVKAQDIVVFDTEHLSSLFERVIIASGTSNRQTRALAASVVDAVRAAGFGKPRVEGEGNGEWIIVDCGQAVVHVMQPTFRAYYNLEELWGDKPVRLKLGAAKPIAASATTPAPDKPAAKSATPSLRRSSAAKKGVEAAFPSRAQIKKAEDAKAAATKKAAAKAITARSGGPLDQKIEAKPRIRTLVVNAPAKPAAKKTASPRKTPSRKA